MKKFFDVEIKQTLDKDPKYRSFLFPRVYLISDCKLDEMEAYPFYGLWEKHPLGKYTVYIQQKTHCYTAEKDGRQIALIGHAFDPFTGEISEKKIVESCLDAYASGKTAFFEIVNRITGVFVIAVAEENKLFCVQDCAGMQMLYYGSAKGYVWLSSSPQLIGDICGLERDPAVLKLLNSRSYYRGSRYLPGDMSPYAELKRLGANFYLEYNGAYRIKRFFPEKARQEYETEEEKEKALESIYRIFRKNIEMIPQKWGKPAISLSGGVDSKTTLACANGIYEKFQYYSFASKPSEKLDADAAAEICKRLHIPHTCYVIPEDPSKLSDYDFLSRLIDHNTAYLMRLNDNEIRKYIYFSQKKDFDVEVKSDSSEIGRAIMQRKYLVRLPDVLSYRHFSIFQARYFCEPELLRFADAQHKEFMKKTALQGPILGYEHINLFFWEVRLASWYATAFFSHQFFHEVVIPYNNRRLMDLFYGFSYKERLQDVPHMRLMRLGNPKVADVGISVKDTYFGKKRLLLETAYYLYATRLNTMGNFYRK